MKKHSIFAFAAAICICCGMAGCGDSNTAPNDTSNAEVSVTEAESAAEETPETEAVNEDQSAEADVADAPAETEGTTEETVTTFAPSQEILDAPLNSGYVQICDDIFRTGGYLTVNDFIAQYGENWIIPENFDTSGEMGGSLYYLKVMNRKNQALEMELACAAAPAESSTKGDAVVIKFKTGGDIAENAWLAGGYQCWNGHYTLDEIIAVHQAAGYQDVYREDNSEVVPANNPTKNVGSSLISTIESQKNNYTNSEDLIAVTELADENLFGVKPVLAVYYGMSDPYDADQTMNNMRAALDAAQSGEVVDDPGIAADSTQRFSHCTFSRIYYKENEVLS